MFKDPPQEMHAEAWRILCAVVKGNELLPEFVRQYLEDSVARCCGVEAPGFASVLASEEAGAAVPGTPCAAMSRVEHAASSPKKKLSLIHI